MGFEPADSSAVPPGQALAGISRGLPRHCLSSTPRLCAAARYAIATMRMIYLSPHLDDAALSAGGLIYDQVGRGQTVETWTLMSGTPDNTELSDFAAEMHARWGTTTVEHTLQVRKTEDVRAAALLGAKPVHSDFADAIYRRGTDGTALYAEPVGAPIHPQDSTLPEQIAGHLGARLGSDDTVICPLAICAHVDHTIVRRAAETLGLPLQCVADIPYVLDHPGELGSQTAALDSTLQRVSEPGLVAWLAAIETYRSQVISLYESWELLREAFRAYWSAEGGIRLWAASRPGTLGVLIRVRNHDIVRGPSGKLEGKTASHMGC
jgi:LmbE family N-acetylglucosaminyl deacetylase